MGPLACRETSVKSYQYTRCNIPEGGRSHRHCSGSLKSRTKRKLLFFRRMSSDGLDAV